MSDLQEAEVQEAEVEAEDEVQEAEVEDQRRRQPAVAGGLPAALADADADLALRDDDDVAVVLAELAAQAEQHGAGGDVRRKSPVRRKSASPVPNDKEKADLTDREADPTDRGAADLPEDGRQGDLSLTSANDFAVVY